MAYSVTTSSTQIVWQTWAESTTTNVTYTATMAWGDWNTASANYAMSPQTEAQIRLDAERKKRAQELLVGCLTARQRHEFNKDGHFHVETAKGRRRYRLAPGRAPVRVHGEDGAQWSYCIHPEYGFPPEDVVLAQKLFLESDEDAFLRIANASRVAVPA